MNLPLHGGRLFGKVAVRGDVVVFRLPRDPQATWVKRIVVASWNPGAGLFKPWPWFDVQPGRFFLPIS